MPLNASEAAIEAELKTKGLNAPRLRPEDIDNAIFSESYYVVPGTTVTVCALKLQNGFVTVGHSACASSENFDPEIGRRVARENARSQIWTLEGYLLRSRLAALEEVSMVTDAIDNKAMEDALREATKL